MLVNRFYKLATKIIANKELEKAALMIYESGKRFMTLEHLLKDFKTAVDIDKK